VEDIETNNAQNLEDLLKLLPSIHLYNISDRAVTSSGILTLQNIAILKDGFPLLMDQNTYYDLRSIPLWDIEYIEVHVAPISNIIKNSSALVIQLYSKEIEAVPLKANAYIINNSATDLHANLQLGLSNLIHTANIGLNRSFTQPLYNNVEDRGTSISAAERYDLNIRYRFQILKSVTLLMSSDNSLLRSQDKGEIIDGTTRVRDVNQDFNRHSLRGTIRTALSKNHLLSLNGMVHRYKNKLSAWDKNLSNAEQQEYDGKDIPFSTGYDQGYMQLLLESNNRDLNYSAGVELSNTIDNQFSNINAIATEYADYSAFGMFQYQFRKAFKLESGVKLITNSLTRSYVLPHGRLTIAPNNELQLQASFQKSLSYARFEELFYTADLKNGISNNILLSPIDLTTFNLKIMIDKKFIKLQSGILYTDKNNVPQLSNFSTLNNNGRSISTTTYAFFHYQKDYIDFRPSVLLHGTNGTRDTSGITFFYPELNFYTQIKVPNSSLTIGSTARFLGKKSTTYLSQDELYLQQIDGHRHLSLSIKNTFKNKKLSILFGINNLFDSNFEPVKTYNFTPFGQDLVSNQSAVVNRNRAFFFKIGYKIK
jgi:hypothetical protein